LPVRGESPEAGGSVERTAKSETKSKSGSSSKSKSKSKTSADSRKPSSSVRISGSVELQVIYDDNILRANEGTILEFRQNASPYKFEIDTYDDLIISPKLNLAIGKKLFGGKESSVRLGFTRWKYAQNPIKNNDAWTFRLRQVLFSRDFIEASYTYAPPAYIRNLSDRPPFTPRTVPLEWLPFKSTRNAFTLGYSRRFTPKLSARADVGRTIRYYNRPFIENDNWEWNAVGTATYGLFPFLRLNGRYGFANVEARAHDSTIESPTESDDGDPSYKRDLYEIEVDVLPRGRLWKVGTLAFTGQYQGYYYTSDRLPWEDDLHVGRKDTVKVFEFGADTAPVIGPVSFAVGYRYTQRRSSLPANIGADAADEKDYNNNRTWVSAVYPF
jgi:hypothetical protein